MSIEERIRPAASRGLVGRVARGVAQALVPTERTIPTREGLLYCLVIALLLAAGWSQQVNLIMLVATLAAGPGLMSLIGGRAFLRRLSVVRRVPAYVFAGDPLAVDYTLENSRRWSAALAVFMEDLLVPVDRQAAGGAIAPKVFFPRVPADDRVRLRWAGPSPRRGRYRFRDLDLGTRAPFGLVERRVTIPLAEEIVVYPRIGRLTRRWFQLQRLANENRMGKRRDSSSQHEEYHGLRDYRDGDSPRWIHWRTSARRGELMVKEFEQQNEQELALLLDPWLPRTKVPPGLRDAMEEAISLAATVCVETCRRQGRRMVLGWTGATPGVCQGQGSVKLLHELLEQLAVMRPASEGSLAELIDALPPTTLRDSLLVIISTRPVQLAEEAERSSRLAGGAARNLLSRTIVLNAAQGEISDLMEDVRDGSRSLIENRLTSTEQERLDDQEDRRRAVAASPAGANGEMAAGGPSEGAVKA
ncbi:hypothetical protein OJF2_18420 [Aquisphaera giovannonii]|uniref:DUF58 domain-containing protein n=1 Tax=Aquisphaera giovannonii TaxID=406548 RepID=A0A5B9VZE0_9BACT|nr:DUF58 domain-containing protein [Aquisphaera giovannonii]QEH33341.1 hypothetical protein OJF2_18420 [Aquisphaera giovannonii]